MLPCQISILKSSSRILTKLLRDAALVRRICLTLRNISSYYGFTSHEKTAGLVMNCIIAIHQPCNVAGVFFCFLSLLVDSRITDWSNDQPIQEERPYHKPCHHHHLYSMRLASVNDVIAASAMCCDARIHLSRDLHDQGRTKGNLFHFAMNKTSVLYAQFVRTRVDLGVS